MPSQTRDAKSSGKAKQNMPVIRNVHEIWIMLWKCGSQLPDMGLLKVSWPRSLQMSVQPNRPVSAGVKHGVKTRLGPIQIWFRFIIRNRQSVDHHILTSL